MDRKFRITKRDFEKMGWQYIGRNKLYGEHYNYYGANRRGDPQFMLNYNRKTGSVSLSKCLDELTVDGLLSKLEMAAKRRTFLDYAGYVVATGIFALCALSALKAFGFLD